MLAFDVYGMSAITAITAQNTLGISGMLAVPPDLLRQQINAVFEDLPPDAVKIGMTASDALVGVILDRLQCYQAKHIVLDTVLASTSGTTLSEMKNSENLKNLLKICELITPNLPEAEILSGISIRSRQDMEQASRLLQRTYGCAVLCKGGHSKTHADDVLCTAEGEIFWYRQEKLANPNTHGTGCTLSSAIACGLAKGDSLRDAIAEAKAYMTEILQSDLDLGQGNGSLDHGFRARRKFENLKNLNLLTITNKILSNPHYLQELALLQSLEQDRIFCKHDMTHFLDVARITLLLCQQEQLPADPDVIYAAALLHDIGRVEEYQKQIPHELASIRKAEAILQEISCEVSKQEEILELIRHHRGSGNSENFKKLAFLFYRADKASRLCFCCPASAECNWSEEKKNKSLEI